MSYTIAFSHGNTYKNIPDKAGLLKIWTEEEFHNLGYPYTVKEDGRTLLAGILKPEDFKILEENTTEQIADCCSGGSCKIEFN